nr:collagen-like protein [Lactiplantibacillus plantarum]MDB7788330.1 collagen-like protein [Lactiplantibacillus plantarum]MDB7791392.1 collagen-like protein [Lactiplantibacillus plantarum]
TGTVDNAGLTAAPAFVNLQTQVNNSAVGTNLLIGTNNTLITVTNATGWGDRLPTYHPAETLKANQNYTMSCYLEPATHDASIVMNTAHGNIFGTTIAAGSKGISTLTITLTQNDVGAVSNFWIAFKNKQTDNSTVSYKGFKLEKGSVATDWSPNPTEVLTQADYAKIKAAIVALGGSLS